MSSMLRGEDMTLCQLYLQPEAAYDAVSLLGEVGLVQFKDLNTQVNAFHKNFVSQIRRAEEMERRLRYFEHELEKEKIQIVDDSSNPVAPPPRAMIDLEAQFESNENDLRELSTNIEVMKQNYTELVEMQYVLRHTDNFLIEGAYQLDSFERTQETSDGGQADPENPAHRHYLGYMSGVIARERLEGFLRLLWFACRGNVFVRHTDIDDAMEDPHTGDMVYKSTFMVFFQGDQLKSKVKKICEGFKASMYPVPDAPEDRQEMKLGVENRLKDLTDVVSKSEEQRRLLLQVIAKHLRDWHIKTLKIKAIYFTLNMFHTEGRSYVAECWLPMSEIGLVQHILEKAGSNSGTTAPSVIHPLQSEPSTLPTFHRTNKFTNAFQVIIDAYGVASYKEINPAPFAVISFPFLFAVMFGDAGHAIIMLLFALFLVLRERHIERFAETNDLFGPIFHGRYIILLMSIFSVYTGLLYNDTFSKSLNIFGSKWNIVYDNKTIRANEKLQLDPADPAVYAGTMYPFGMDPIWQISLNKITWSNSFKEKVSVILGVSQMLLGVLLSLFNHIYFRRWLNIICEFIPMLLFLLGIFGYLCALIIAKWIQQDAKTSNCAPDILIAFINMFLMKYPKEGDGTACSGQMWYTGQQGVQIFLVVLCVCCALFMLLVKPIYLWFQHKHRPLVSAAANDYEQIVEVQDFSNIVPEENGVEQQSDSANTVDSGDDQQRLVVVGLQDEFEFGELFIHQCIHTIEFCLGCVSHTASYLRLWALSLAHSQLSEVLWNMVLRIGLKINAYWACIVIFFLFAFWAVATIVILLCMEGLSAFLHTLRLHWVEFQSKFYTAEGFPFEAFQFRDILREAPRVDS